MALVPTRQVVDDARLRGGGAAAFNVITLEHAEAIVTGAEAAGRAVILQVSENAVRFHHGRLRPISAGAGAVAEGAGVPVALHLDHVEDLDLLHEAAAAGFSSAMFDASRLPYDDNVAATGRGGGLGARRRPLAGGRAGRGRRQGRRPRTRRTHRPRRGRALRRADRGRRPRGRGGELARDDHPHRPARPGPDRGAA